MSVPHQVASLRRKRCPKFVLAITHTTCTGAPAANVAHALFAFSPSYIDAIVSWFTCGCCHEPRVHHDRVPPLPAGASPLPLRLDFLRLLLPLSPRSSLVVLIFAREPQPMSLYAKF